MSLTDERIAQLDCYVRAANYLGAAQIYLRDNAQLRQPLQPDHIKARLLGHWGTQPGITLLYAHLNRLIQDTGQETLLVVGPGHGAPAVLANLWLEGTLGEHYPAYRRDAAGMAAFLRAFSWPGGLPSHVTALTPGAIHEGGELGYALAHATGAAMDNPGLVVACMVGDGEAETGPLAASWHFPKFLNPARDGKVLPVLHLNGYKLSGPTILARMDDATLEALFRGYGLVMRLVAGDTPAALHQPMAAALDWAMVTLAAGQHPVIVLRTPKGMTGPKTLDGKAVEGTFHSHQVPIEHPADNPGHLRALEAWLRSYQPEILFTDGGEPVAAVLAMLPQPEHRLGRSRHANGGAVKQALVLPPAGQGSVAVELPGGVAAGATTELGTWLAGVFEANGDRFRLFCPDETSSNKLAGVYRATQRDWQLPTVPTDEHLAPDGRVLEVLSEHLCEGWLEGYVLTGRHGIFACYEAFIGIVDSMVCQYAKWQKMAREVPWRRQVASLNILLTSHVWEQDHNGYSHQGPTFINTLLTKKSAQIGIFLPPDVNCLLHVAAACLRSEATVNLIVSSKKPQPQWLGAADAAAHCERGASVWRWASCDGAPDVVLAAAGDVPTREMLAAVALLRQAAPDLAVQAVNVVDLLRLETPGEHPGGLSEAAFAELFTPSCPVVFAFHGYPMVVHELLHGRPEPQRFHVHGYREEGTTTTPFDMLVLNRMSRFDLANDALRRCGRNGNRFDADLARHRAWIAEHDDDLPDILAWRWPQPGS